MLLRALLTKVGSLFRSASNLSAYSPLSMSFSTFWSL
jgi:hypothetical protein